MRLVFYWYLLLPVSAFCQDGEWFLNYYASELANNRSVQTRFFFTEKRELNRLDTLSATCDNYRYRALNYVWKHDYEQAAVWLEKTTALYPKEHGFVGEIYLEQLRDYPRALAHLNAYDALTPTFNDMISNSPVSYLRGLTYRSLGDHRKAIEQFSIGIDSLISKHGPEWVNYRHYVSRAVSYIATQQPNKALADLDRAAKNFSRSALVQFHRGQALLRLNRLAEAQTAFRDASFFSTLRGPNILEIIRKMISILFMSRRLIEALANLKSQNH